MLFWFFFFCILCIFWTWILCQMFSCICGFLYAIVTLAAQRLFSIMRSQISIVNLHSLEHVFLFRKSFLKGIFCSVLSILPSIIFLVSCFILDSLIHLDVIFGRVIDMDLISHFCMWTKAFPTPFVEVAALFFSSICLFCFFARNHMNVITTTNSWIFYLIPLVYIAVFGWYYVVLCILNSTIAILSVFFLFRTALSTEGLFWFYVNFRFFSVKNFVEILTWIIVNL